MIRIRPAGAEDNGALLDLTRRCPMVGAYTLMVDREPDYFRLLRTRGEGFVLVAEEDGLLLGAISGVQRDMLMAGRPVKSLFIADFKVAPESRGRGLAARLCRALWDAASALRADLAQALVMGGNIRVLPFVAGRAGFPPFMPLGRFSVDNLFALPSPPRCAFSLQRAGEGDWDEIMAVHASFSRGRGLSPAWSPGGLAGFRPGDAETWVARKAGRIEAVLSLHDPRALKQSVVLTMPVWTRWLLAGLRLFGRPFGLPLLPREGDSLSLLYFRAQACRQGSEGALRELFLMGRHQAWRRGCPFALLGLHETDPLRILLRGMNSVTFPCQGFAAPLRPEIKADLQAAAALAPAEDFSIA